MSSTTVSNLFAFKQSLKSKRETCKNFNSKLPVVIFTYSVFLGVPVLRLANAHAEAFIFNCAVRLANGLLIEGRMISQGGSDWSKLTRNLGCVALRWSNGVERGTNWRDWKLKHLVAPCCGLRALQRLELLKFAWVGEPENRFVLGFGGLCLALMSI